jgi:hypothetical protein
LLLQIIKKLKQTVEVPNFEVSMKKACCILLILLCSSFAFGQTDKSTKTQIVELPLSRPKFKPKLTLQEALKLMDKFIEKNKIDTSKYWFSSARMIQYGGEKEKKQPVWFFEWMNDNGTLGDYLHILVSMDGGVWQMPTM